MGIFRNRVQFPYHICLPWGDSKNTRNILIQFYEGVTGYGCRSAYNLPSSRIYWQACSVLPTVVLSFCFEFPAAKRFNKEDTLKFC
jgi:hypothetical protein